MKCSSSYDVGFFGFWFCFVFVLFCFVLFCFVFFFFEKNFFSSSSILQIQEKRKNFVLSGFFCLCL